MGVHKVAYFQVECDSCGAICDDYGTFSAFVDAGQALDNLPEDWEEIGEMLFCGDCDLPQIPPYVTPEDEFPYWKPWLLPIPGSFTYEAARIRADVERIGDLMPVNPFTMKRGGHV